ncbi:hypothetical protein RCL1_005435 [Eukaryota sp. TZLM3-RCL]
MGKHFTEKELTQQLSKHDSKTLDIESFKIYLKQKLEYNKLVGPLSNDMVWRRHRFWRFQNIQRSESEMVNAIAKLTIQRPLTTRNVVIDFGDWEMRHQRKKRPPTKDKGLRAVLRVAGFLLFLVDEYRTSKLCAVCVLAGREGINKSDVSAKDPNAFRPTSYWLKELKREMRHSRVCEGENSSKFKN